MKCEYSHRDGYVCSLGLDHGGDHYQEGTKKYCWDNPKSFKRDECSGASLGGGESEAVDHPSHYNASPSGVECIDVVEHMTFNVGNAIKYLWRAGHKGKLLEDLRKARWYVDREIERLEKEKKS